MVQIQESPGKVKLRLTSCPLCRGLGQTISISSQVSNPRCEFCFGRGMVIANKPCDCGDPRRVVKEKVWFCGKTYCYDKLKSLEGNQ